MTSVVGICNLALTRIGAQTIAALTEASPAARACVTLYEPTRDSMLRLSPWRWARRRTVLALDEIRQSTEWSYIYAVPSDCLRPLYIEAQSGLSDEFYLKSDLVYARPGTVPGAYRRFEMREDGRLYTSVDNAVLIYTAKITDPTQFDPLFVEALSWRLGMDLAMALKSDSRKRQEVREEYVTALNEARARDAGDAFVVDVADAQWVVERV